MKLFLGAFLAGLLAQPVASGAEAPELEFSRVWRAVREGSPAIQAARHEAQAAEIGRDRASRHWYPHAYLAGRIFSTNDPTASFFSLLGQRQVGAADFAPGALNHPGSRALGQGTLGLELPLYEGGMKAAQERAAGSTKEAGHLEEAAQERADYARAASAFASLLVFAEERRQLLTLREAVSGLLERYAIGTRANPVGYSGLLGLKNLRNRVDGLLVELEARAAASRSEAGSLAPGLPENWRPKASRAKDFLAQAFPGQERAEGPAAVRAALARAESMDARREAERGLFLPTVGLFAQSDLHSGARATAAGYAAGAYLRWDLFSAPNFGAVEQAGHEAAAARARAELLERSLRSGHEAAVAGASSAERNLALLDESARLLEEQTRTARDLFRNGSINALQLAEVLNRRADLLQQRAEAELALGKMKSELYLTSSSLGGFHE